MDRKRDNQHFLINGYIPKNLADDLEIVRKRMNITQNEIIELALTYLLQELPPEWHENPQT